MHYSFPEYRSADGKLAGALQRRTRSSHFYARCLERKNLQFTVVSGRHGADALSMQMTQNRDGKSSAFGRIGSGTKFVEEYQRIVLIFIKNETIFVM